MSDMTGRTCVITGPTAGIGRATAVALAERGARLGLVARNPDKLETLAEELRARSGADVVPFVADLSVQRDVRRVGAEILERFDALHVLVNNAGLFEMALRETEDGLEATLAVNHLAYFLLTEILRPRLVESAPARIVVVASDAHRFADLDLEDLEFRRRPYKMMRVYGTSKLLNILWSYALARRLEGSGVTVNCLHPGGVNTGLGDQNGRVLAVLAKLVKVFMRSPERGAATSIHLATAPELERVSGCYFADCREHKSSAISHDRSVQEKLWEISEGLVRASA
jgi:NAD(P)-dependent dehydrogenase (short-subunit alcohol dehydrogenase family)